MSALPRFLLILLLTTLLLTPCLARRRQEVLEQQQQPQPQREIVTQANHFSSATQTKTNYELSDIQKDKPLLFILKPHETQSTDHSLQDNPITITLEDGTNSKTCTFSTYTGLCALPKVATDKPSLKIECKSTPCQLSWLIVQPGLQEEDGLHGVDQLVSVNKDKNHASLKVYCNNPDLAEAFQKDIVLYTNSKYDAVPANRIGMIYFLFDNEEEGYYYLTSSDERVKECANASLQHMNDEINFNSDKGLFFDFLQPDHKSTYQFESIPDKDYRIQAQAYDITMQELTNATSLKIDVIGYTGKDKHTVSSIELSVENQKTSIEFSLVYKKPTTKYDTMDLEVTADGQVLMLKARFITADIHEVELGELSFFDLKKGDKLDYKLVPVDPKVEGVEEVFIFASDKNFKVDKTSCPKTGCEFTVEAEADGQGNLYVGESKKKDIKEIIIQDFNNSIKAKIGPGQIKNYAYPAKAKEAVQLLINVPSAVVYAASKAKCPEIDIKNCYEVSFNHHFPAIYEPKEDGPLLFKVVGLDYTEFELTVIDGKTPFVELKDTTPFSYLFDDKESQLIFEFNLAQKQDVSFNLIAPVNQLNLYVLNEARPAENNKVSWNTAQISSDGFIKFDKEQVQGLSFAIKVEKRSQFQNKYIHFTLIASTKEANLRLQAGQPHYQTLKAKDSRDYVFEFIPSMQLFLNLYTHNLKTVNLSLQVSNADEYSNPNNTAQFTIDKSIDVLDISLVSQRLCRLNQGENCQLYVRITNKMTMEADLTLTLMANNAIVELKDGIWQSYAINMASTSSHFYFLPQHLNHSATIFYKTTSIDLRVLYNVWKSDDLSISPAEWPFPVDSGSGDKRLQFKPVQYVHVQPQKLTECWPNCVILMSLFTDPHQLELTASKNESAVEGHFKIMASNNYIELPQKHKIDILLAKNEAKELLVDLKYIMDKEALTFYTHKTIGEAKITANIYSETRPQCPNPEDEPDFTLDNIETSIPLQDIKKKLEQLSLENDKNVYLCIRAASDQNTKFNIEFSSNGDGFKKLSIDTTATLKSINHQTLYYLDNSQEIYLKISREQGFPFYHTRLCKPDEELSKCFDQFAEDKEEGTQIANKVTTLSEKPCPKCILLLKITAKEQTDLTLHAQSKFTELELTANNLVSDTLAANEQNRYTLTGTRDEEIIINIQIQAGDLKVGVHDFQKVDLTKTNAKDAKNIHITVLPKDLAPAAKELGASHLSSFGLSNFVHLHITVQSQDLSKPASYSITYSSGAPMVYLQDGLITEYNLIAKKETKFIYKNPTNTPIYLYTSTSDAESLKKLKLHYYALDEAEAEQDATVITPSKAEFQKKTVNPTFLSQLPGKKEYYFTITNDNDKNILFTIGVNNREIIYLPFDHDFPIQLGPSEYLYIVLKVAVEGHVRVSFSKCLLSYPYIAYTTDYNQFIQEDYQIEDQMDQDLRSELVLKVKADSALYIKVRSSELEKTVMAIRATFSHDKIKVERAKPGDKGLIQYQLLDSTKAELTFTPLVCQDKTCSKDFTYTSVRADTLDSIYSQLVCPSIMFSLPQVQQLKAATLTPIVTQAGSTKITFTQQIGKDIQYVGVKAVNQKTGEIVYYQPVEIVTFWGQLHRSSQTTIILAFFIVLILALGCLMVYRKYKRNEYRPLGELNDGMD